MAHPDDFDFLVECGCTVCDASLGIQKMPDGYHLMLNADQSHFFWMERATGRYSVEHWNKWPIYRGAKEDAEASNKALREKSRAYFDAVEASNKALREGIQRALDEAVADELDGWYSNLRALLK